MTTEVQSLTDSWDDVVRAEVGHIFLDRHEDGVRFLIMRGPSALCGYVGVPDSHPLAGQDYDNVPVECHGGLTFAAAGGTGKREPWPAGWYWYGWDYGHAGDYSTYYDDPPLAGRYDHSKDTKWTPRAVDADSWSALYSFKKLARLAESIAARTPAGVGASRPTGDPA